MTSGWRARIALTLADSQPRHGVEDWQLPGLSVSDSRAFRSLFPPEPIPAAVLIPLVDRGDGLTVLLTQRATQLKNHAGQISFPGGRIEVEDVDPRAAALREAREEIGLEGTFISVAGYLCDHILLTGFRVTPVVAFVHPGFDLRLDEREVQETFEAPLIHVFDPANRHLHRRIAVSDRPFAVWDIEYQGRHIWGATAGMLLNLYARCVSPVQIAHE